MSRTPEYADWIDEARRRGDLREVAERHGAKLRRHGSELVGPCPVCGGEDRFSIHLRKGLFFCRKAGRAGDVIALQQYLTGCSFEEAVAVLAGRAPPCLPSALTREDGSAARRPSIDTEADNKHRQKERVRAYDIWRAGQPITGTPAEAYLIGRALRVPDGAPLRYGAAVKYWWKSSHAVRAPREGGSAARRPHKDGWRVIHNGPAMLAAITCDLGKFQGVHITWIDPDLPGEKATIADPETGELLVAKKMRGSKRRGAIRLVDWPSGPPARSGLAPAGEALAPTRVVIGEGIETVLSVWIVEDRPDTAYWSAMDLGHLGGKSQASMRHPTLKVTDARGRIRAARVPGPWPEPDPDRDLMLTGGMSEGVLLGDGDSDHFTTEMHLRRAATRLSGGGGAAFGREPGRPATIRIAWAEPGTDFNVMLRRAVREKEAA